MSLIRIIKQVVQHSNGQSWESRKNKKSEKTESNSGLGIGSRGRESESGVGVRSWSRKSLNAGFGVEKNLTSRSESDVGVGKTEALEL